MSEDMSPRPKSFSDSELLECVENHENPFVTVNYLCDELGVSTTAVSQRLDKLEHEQKILSKKVGASARVWWLPD